MTPDTHLKMLHERTVKGTLRRVWTEGQGVVKEFRCVRWPGDLRRPWIKEHRALVRLARCGVAAPATYGYARVSPGTIQLRRQFVPGQKLTVLPPAMCDACAHHLADIHAAGVTINDVSLDNVIVQSDGQLIFIDYGRSRVFWFRSPLFYFYVGKELARFFYQNLAGTEWAAFRECYTHAVRYPAWGWNVVRAAESYWLRQWEKRRAKDPRFAARNAQTTDVAISRDRPGWR